MPASTWGSGSQRGAVHLGNGAQHPDILLRARGGGARLIVVKHHRGEQSGKYVNVAVLEGDQIKLSTKARRAFRIVPTW